MGMEVFGGEAQGEEASESISESGDEIESESKSSLFSKPSSGGMMEEELEEARREARAKTCWTSKSQGSVRSIVSLGSGDTDSLMGEGTLKLAVSGGLCQVALEIGVTGIPTEDAREDFPEVGSDRWEGLVLDKTGSLKDLDEGEIDFGGLGRGARRRFFGTPEVDGGGDNLDLFKDNELREPTISMDFMLTSVSTMKEREVDRIDCFSPTRAQRVVSVCGKAYILGTNASQGWP